MSPQVAARALAVAALCLVGCAPSAPAPRPTSDDGSSLAPEALVAPARWRLTELMGRPVPAASDPAKQPSLAFDRDGNKVHGFAGCNHFAGSFELRAGSRIRFSQLAATQMACPEMTTESEFLGILGSVDSYALVENALTLHRARMAPLARFEAVYP